MIIEQESEILSESVPAPTTKVREVVNKNKLDLLGDMSPKLCPQPAQPL